MSEVRLTGIKKTLVGARYNRVSTSDDLKMPMEDVTLVLLRTSSVALTHYEVCEVQAVVGV